jgi:hypothetical protein
VPTASGRSYRCALALGFLLAASSLATVSSPPVAAAPSPVVASFRQGLDGYTGTVDTWLNSASASTSYRTATSLQVDSSGGAATEQTVVRFDDIFGNGPGQIPTDATIQSATLTMHLTNTGNAPTLHRMKQTWADTATWTTSGAGIQTDGVEAVAAADAVFAHAAPTNVSYAVDVATSIAAWKLAPSSNFGWLIQPTGSDGVFFASAEQPVAAQRPRLDVTYVPSGSNHAPVATADVRAVNAGGTVRLTPLRNDFDTDGDPLSITGLTQPAHGAVVDNGDGSLTYTPTAGYTGNDQFTYSAGDGSASSPATNVSLSVVPLPAVLATPSSPFTPAADPAGAQTLLAESAALSSTPAELVTPHPTAAEVYGAVPAGAPRTTSEVEVTVTNPAAAKTLHPTGLYAAPGELVYVTVPAALAGVGARVVISTHSDSISDRETWLRVPYGVNRGFSIVRTVTPVAGSFGGLIYIETPSSGPNGAFPVSIEGAVQAPLFVLGETTDAQWVSSIRNRPAPWAVLRSGNLDISLPSEHVRALSNPTALMTFWKEAVDAQDDLAGITQRRTRPEGISIDVQVGFGYLHSGYPTQGPYEAAPELVDLETLSATGSWGWFHELGHEHQRGMWTVDGDGEVTVNLFGLYAYERLGLSNFRQSTENRVTQASLLLGAGGAYAGGDALQKLVFYQQIVEGFGWEPMRTFMRSYYDDTPESLNARFGVPATNQAEIDQWLIRLSTITGRDLSPHFDAWGHGVTQAARDTVAGLPKWSIIENLAPTETVIAVDGASTPVVLADNVYGLPGNGALTFTARSGPAHGALTNLGNGTFNYAPAAGFVGVEDVVVDVTNTQGGTTSITVTVASTSQLVVSSVVDTRFGQGYPTSSFAAAPELVVDGVDGDYPVASLLRFPSLFGTGPGQIPPGAVIVRAELQLQFSNSGAPFAFHRVLRDWNAADTWTTLGAGMSTDDVEAVATPELETTANPVGLRTFDLTASVAAWSADPASNRGWLLQPGTSSDGNGFSSSEGANPPRLVVSWAPAVVVDTPPPSGVLEFGPTPAAWEHEGVARIEVRRVGGSRGPVSATVVTRAVASQGADDAVAAENADFTPTSVVLSWADGEEGSKWATVPMLLDGHVDRGERFEAALTSVTGVSQFAAPTAIRSRDGDMESIQPARLLETRPGQATIDGKFAGNGPNSAGQIIRLRVAGRGGVPIGAAAASVNVTVVGPDRPGYLTLFPCTSQLPTTSTLNYAAGRVAGNSAIAKLDAAGDLCVFTIATTHVVVDVNGFVPQGSPVVAIAPGRVHETRPGKTTGDGLSAGVGAVPGGTFQKVQIAGRVGVPAGARGVMLNVTSVMPSGSGFLTVYPCTAELPNASAVNYRGSDVVGNAVFAQLAADGSVCVYSRSTADVVIDVVGYTPSDILLESYSPIRVFDSRPGQRTFDGQYAGGGLLRAGVPVEIKIAGRLPSANGVVGLLANVVAVNPEAAGFITVYPCSADVPLASTLNYRAGDVVANNAFAKLSADGRLCVFSRVDTHIVVDVVGATITK